VKQVFGMDEKDIKKDAKNLIEKVKKKLINDFIDNLDSKISASEGSGTTGKLHVHGIEFDNKLREKLEKLKKNEKEKDAGEYQNATSRINQMLHDENINEDVEDQTVRISNIQKELKKHKNGSLKGASYISNALTCMPSFVMI
jgi:maltooligosyltrehalose synthase